MNKGIVFVILGLLALIASLVMYFIGNNSSHLTELKQYCLTPVPLGFIFIGIGIKSIKKS